jgi:hypothetical protein
MASVLLRGPVGPAEVVRNLAGEERGVTVRQSMLKLREDAIERDMLDLAGAYGWSAIRLGEEEFQQHRIYLDALRKAWHDRTRRPL